MLVKITIPYETFTCQIAVSCFSMFYQSAWTTIVAKLVLLLPVATLSR